MSKVHFPTSDTTREMDCTDESCERVATKRGYCGAHYQQWKRTGTTWPFGTNPNRGRKPCTFPGCGRRNHSGGLCGAHSKQKRMGLELRPVREPRPSDTEDARYLREAADLE